MDNLTSGCANINLNNATALKGLPVEAMDSDGSDLNHQDRTFPSAAGDTITDEAKVPFDETDGQTCKTRPPQEVPKTTDLATNAEENVDVLFENAMSVAAEIDDYLTEVKQEPRVKASALSHEANNPLGAIKRNTFVKNIDKFNTLSEEISHSSEIPELEKRKEELTSRIRWHMAKMEKELREAEAELKKLTHDKFSLQAELEQINASEKSYFQKANVESSTLRKQNETKTVKWRKEDEGYPEQRDKES